MMEGESPLLAKPAGDGAPVSVVAGDIPSARPPEAMGSPDRNALWRSVFREDRFFLVLSVFIGVLSLLNGCAARRAAAPHNSELRDLGLLARR